MRAHGVFAPIPVFWHLTFRKTDNAPKLFQSRKQILGNALINIKDLAKEDRVSRAPERYPLGEQLLYTRWRL